MHDQWMDKRMDVASNARVKSPSLLLACFGFAASTTTMVGVMTVLGSLA
jgi:hypothetical protein